MAQLLIVTKRCPKTEKSYNVEGAQNNQDLLGIFEDSHIFSGTEQSLFDIRQVPQMTEAELESYVEQLEVIVEEMPDGREKWFHTGQNKWFVLKEVPKFTINLKRINNPMWNNIEDGTYTKEQVESYLQSAVDKVIEEITDNMIEEVI